jgi:3-dehydro-L-gulonate 2-dehydrogenase
MNETITITAEEMQATFQKILVRHGFAESRAGLCAGIFTSNSVDGVYTHGVNRFPRFVHYIQKGYVDVMATPSLKHSFGGMEQWEGNLGAGPLNAVQATERSMQLAQQHGIGAVALANTNHWMRGGYYGWKAAKAGFVFIGWTNTIANLPAWNAKDSRLGNNPLVMALPFNGEAIVLDMAMSQFSFGAMELAALKKEDLPVFGGYDKEGRLTQNPTAIIESQRPLPIGFWKGAGLSLLLDILATLLSAGLSTSEVSEQKAEYKVSQVFIAIDLSRLQNHSLIAATINRIIHHYHQSIPVEEGRRITYPGERVLQTRMRNKEQGIPVMKVIWQQILEL